MVLFVVAGVVHCPDFAHADYLADFLSQRLPSFQYHRIVKEENEWKEWLKCLNRQHGWSHWKGPIIWRESGIRGGAAALVGGLHDFLEYCHEYYGICSFLTYAEKRELVEENIKELECEKSARKLWEEECMSYEQRASAVVIGAASAGQTLRLLIAELFTLKVVKKVLLWEEDEIRRSHLENQVKDCFDIGPTIILDSLVQALSNTCIIVVLQFSVQYTVLEGHHPSTKFYCELCNYAKSALKLAEEIRKNTLNPECRLLIATGVSSCFSAAVLAEAIADRLNPLSVVALTADPDLLPEVVSTRWSLQPAVWGWPSVAHLVDISGAKVGVTWLEPARRALKEIPCSTLPQGTWHAEIRPLRCVPQLQRPKLKQANPEFQMSLARLRAIMNVLQLWFTEAECAGQEVVSLGVFSDGTHCLPRGLMFSQPAVVNSSGIWAPCDLVASPLDGPVRLQDILTVPLRATAFFGLGKCLKSVWTRPQTEVGHQNSEFEVANNKQLKKEGKLKAWKHDYELLDRLESKVLGEIEKEAVSIEARYRWLDVSERLMIDEEMEKELTKALPSSEIFSSLTKTIFVVNREESDES